MSDYINNLSYLIEIRKTLRKNLTAAEAALWLKLKNKQIDGKRFRRQFSVGHFVLDFYCPEQKLAVELDGHYHFTSEGMEYDRIRDIFLAEHGIRVLRIENKWIFERPEAVIDAIRNSFV